MVDLLMLWKDEAIILTQAAFMLAHDGDLKTKIMTLMTEE